MSLEQMCPLGSQGFKVSRLGLGCMGLSAFYGPPLQEEAGINLIKHAINSGVSFLDTSDIYGPFTNELLVGKAMKHFPREHIQLATKFGNVSKNGVFAVKGSADYVSQACEPSLKRLYVDYIDLYYQHRVDQSVPIEETVGDAEEDVIPTCRELGIAYSPLGHGFFSGKAILESLDATDVCMVCIPRFQGENLEKNKVFYERIANLAKKHACTPGQLALAWVLRQGDDVVLIPGTTKTKNFDENEGALKVKLSVEDLEEISSAVPAGEVSGERHNEQIDRLSYKYADTPPLKCECY
ncbi:hypothetical protein GOP47_0020788 [Adiantum capillus-veneris]|uniref:NADP-dependent oxidoreductase domain-containing protein n=1 Tax=Adiantum capillus-veneris TaxID=13818 RepID=A0A9D4Z6F0_ADICA|nr:hypothetical protein GOP47_0020788 [Adiantum capillus-veneris]